MEKIRVYKKEIQFHLLLNILIATFITFACYIHIPLGDKKGVFMYVVHFILLQISIFGFTYLLSLIKKLFLIIFPILFFINSCLAFWVYTQDISIDIGMIQAISETKLDIAIDTLSWQFILYILLVLIVITFTLKYYVKLKRNTVYSPLIIISIIGVLTFFLVENYSFGAFKRKLPYSSFFSMQSYLSKSDLVLKNVNKNLKSNEDNLHIIFVLGESVRADHLSLNGYFRETNPLLSKQKNLISFKNIYTPLTYTAISVPQILTDKSVLDTAYVATSMYSVLNNASFKTEWIGNQSLEKSFKDIVYTNKTVKIIDQFHSVLSLNKEKDAELLNNTTLNKKFDGNKITTIHMIGSHWYYNSRVDENYIQFKPITSSKYLGSSTTSELINSYDNTILYLDEFLNSTIETLKKSSKKTILIYLSDHGEILGEDGKWFHAQNHKSSQNPAMLIWFSEKFKETNEDKISKLISKKTDTISTDFLFHSILDLAKIKGYNFRKELSLFN